MLILWISMATTMVYTVGFKIQLHHKVIDVIQI
jgi:hypothetical protein